MDGAMCILQYDLKVVMGDLCSFYFFFHDKNVDRVKTQHFWWE